MPLCSTNIDDEITLFAVDMKKGENFQFPLKISAQTKLTTRLDFDKLIEEKEIGHGSFGIVYKGIYRGNCVAIKKMKEIKNDDDEFEKEVNMLDKFRSDFIVHFYGAVFIPNKVCMVTEFGLYGSLQDLMKHKTSEKVEMKFRIKILVDAAKGIIYLHENGVLHRDIKPDNILMFSMDFFEKVNAKLTDFGSARSVNLLMTNMTFTKNVGTPTYMAPEILNKEKYKKSADVFSFAITMYETFGWREAYPVNTFKFPWKIAEFVISGERLPRLDNMLNSHYTLICVCWSKNKNERLSISKIEQRLNLEFNK
ncbi:interleukin-1 receptor-associated kinase, putative [Entamoeba invadens IP1]|uniref:Interleukin-1 receptor-associated kinase, putative n=1 Tax=Entamoeba invadens IP1 TaxID=370355 RepID=L7FNG2_ENTIV|nr:interleukin-1 receptor-associated kinase, putative [Entamoeba invadens IP1]ELP87947.1 interleukin-1 receptor-associated kinase, putative [Entamoeba invadens IP1]|eukprot:XP_004254718.1 interleukin-1 receptor-associated kinase, putative [Entamoeba invadens IP1]